MCITVHFSVSSFTERKFFFLRSLKRLQDVKIWRLLKIAIYSFIIYSIYCNLAYLGPLRRVMFNSRDIMLKQDDAITQNNNWL